MPEDRKLPDFSRFPMLLLVGAFSVGILLQKIQNADIRFPVLFCLLLALLAVFLRKHQIATFLILAAFMAAGMSAALIEASNISPNRLRVLYDNGTVRSGDSVEVEGVLLGAPEPSIDGVFLNLRSEKLKYHGNWLNVSGNVRLFLQQADDPDSRSDLKSEIPDLRYGSRLQIVCKLDREDEYLNPGVMPKTAVLDRLGVDATGSVKSSRLVERVADESVFMPLVWVYDQRATLIADFENNLSRSAAGIMIASLLGDKYFLDKDTADLFREGGTFHILVISGLHITFIGGLLLLVMRQLTRNRWLQFIVTVSALWAYTFAVGADVPVVRAAIMFTVVLYSHVIYRQASLLNSLGFCGLILLVWRPSDLFNSSFQLTFVSVAAIVVFAYPLIETLRLIGTWTPSAERPFPPNVPDRLKRICEFFYWNEDAWKFEAKRQIWTANLFKKRFKHSFITGGFQKALRYLFEGILVSLIVQMCMLPLSIVYFHRVSVISILLNLWVGFFIALESFAAVIGAVVSHFSSLLAAGFFAFAEVFNWLMLALPRLFSDNGWVSFRLPSYSGAWRVFYFLYIVPVLVIAFALNRWRPFEIKSQIRLRPVLIPAFAALFLFAAIIVFHPFSAPQPDGRLHFDFLDVGQGDSALVTFPDGKTLLVDGGGKVRYKTGDEESEPFTPDVRSIGEAVVSEFLWNRGYSRIDYILATHADADHISGLTDVARNFGVRSALFGRTPMNDPDFAALAEVLKRRGIPSDTLAQGDLMKFGDVRVEVLYPVANDDPNAISDNDHSLVLRIVYGSRAFLLTGDIERSAENALVTGGGTIAADLIKVPHHGSRTSSTEEFIDAVGAKYAVISVGRPSPFGHPHPEIVERWKAAGATVMTTGEQGTISVSTDGSDIAIQRFEH
ncbi:DNA internalization-related competence protein ComEC/Rec2 [soil metagenome]